AALTTPSQAVETCASSLTLCAPAGATNTLPPSIGTLDFTSLYADLLLSPLPPPPSQRKLKRATAPNTASLCCQSTLSCLSMSTLALPFCYDKFTTNYYLADSSFGTLANGTYYSRTGDFANLQTGDYTFMNGTSGNIYAADPAAKPDTATLPMPTQYTASGVGSAIPASELGGKVTETYTTTLPGSTVAASTVLPSTVSEAVQTQTSVLQATVTTTVSGSAVVSTMEMTSLEPTTRPASTISGTTVDGTTVSASVAIVTTIKAGGSSSVTSSSASASSTKKSAAVQSNGGSLAGFACCIVAVAVFMAS
ncbi:hypothetical protein LSUE1_G005654, partial [Lachnellula suecica]